MSYQQGITPIPDGVDTLSVEFPAAYTATPELVLAIVENVTDVSPTSYSAMVTAKSSTGFTVYLDGVTSTANYNLVWMAGSASLLYKVVTAVGLNVASTPYINGTPNANSYFVVVDMSGTPAVSRLKWSTVSTLFAKFVATPPSAPTDAGSLGEWSVDTKYLYTHDGTLWGRFPRTTSNWDIEAPSELVQEGTAALVADTRTITITFAEPFGGPVLITFSFENVAVGTKQILTGLITARSQNGFTVTLNTTPDTDAYVMHWRASGALP